MCHLGDEQLESDRLDHQFVIMECPVERCRRVFEMDDESKDLPVHARPDGQTCDNDGPGNMTVWP